MQDDTRQIQEIMAKRTAKNSVFLDLFQNKSYLLKLYKTLHPEDTTATEDSLTDVTIENVLTDNLYNDLGFIVNNKLMILVEAQSTWTMNILVRVLLYLAQSYHEYFQRTNQNYYKSKKDTPVSREAIRRALKKTNFDLTKTTTGASPQKMMPNL